MGTALLRRPNSSRVRSKAETTRAGRQGSSQFPARSEALIPLPEAIGPTRYRHGDITPELNLLSAPIFIVMTALKRQTAARLERILDAAREIMRKTGSVGFTMKDVADRAEVAPATVFNLLGTKDGLLYALLSRLLDDLFIGVVRYQSQDPLEHPIEATDFVVDLFLSDPVVFRELFLVFLGTRDELHRPWFMHRSIMFWRHSVEAAAQAKRLPPEESDADDLPRALMLGFIGCVDLWVHGDLDDAGFRAQSLYGALLTMLGVADDAGQKRLRARIKDVKRHLPRHHTFLRHLVPSSMARSRPARSAVRFDGPSSGAPAKVDVNQSTRGRGSSKQPARGRTGTKV